MHTLMEMLKPEEVLKFHFCKSKLPYTDNMLKPLGKRCQNVPLLLLKLWNRKNIITQLAKSLKVN